MEKEELVNVKGGASTTTTIINTIIKVVNLAIEIGRTIGTTIRRKMEGKSCKL